MASNSTATPTPTPTDDAVLPAGFLTAQLVTLPVALKALFTLFCLVIGLGLCVLTPYASRWGTQLGRGGGGAERFPASAGEDISGEGRKWAYCLNGGVLGLVSGSIAGATLVLLLTLQVLANQDDPSLSPYGILALVIAAGLVGAIVGGRWKATSRLLLSFSGAISYTLLFAASFRIAHKLGRLILLLLFSLAAFVLSFGFSITPRTTLQRLATRSSLALTPCTGAWLAFGVGVELWIKSGLLDSLGLLVAEHGVGIMGKTATAERADVVVEWKSARCRGLLAGIWLVTIIGIAFQQWRYSVIGDDPEESWNSYLGALLRDEKTLLSRASAGINSRNATMHESPLMLDNNRAGAFTKQQSVFSRIFGGRASSGMAGRGRGVPATYAMPPEQADERQQDMQDLDGDKELGMQEQEASPGSYGGSRGRASAKYDSLGFSTVGAHRPEYGLYDAADYDAQDAYHASGIPSDEHAYDNRGLQYDPASYGLTRTNTEPSFTSVPKYSPPREIDELGQFPPPLLQQQQQYQPYMSPGTSLGHHQQQQQHGQFDSLSGKTVVGSMASRSEAQHKGVYTDQLHSEPQEQHQVEAAQGLTDSVPIPATPSLLYAINRVSQAQAQAKEIHAAQQQQRQHLQQGQAALGRVASGPGSAPSRETSISPRLPDSERAALHMAAKRRQASAEWWNEVERKANEGMSSGTGREGREGRIPLPAKPAAFRTVSSRNGFR